MSDLPNHVDIHEEGPREGFQIEPGPIPTADKIALIEALAATGLRHIQICSFVNTRLVPGWADAEAVAGGFRLKDGVHYTALWFNENGLNRALAFADRLTMNGSISLTASEGLARALGPAISTSNTSLIALGEGIGGGPKARRFFVTLELDGCAPPILLKSACWR